MIQKILIAFCLACPASPALAVERGYLGVWFGDIPARVDGVQTGVIVKKVFAGMAAQKAGLKPGVIVTQINGIAIRDPMDGVALLAENAAGEKIRLTVIDTTASGFHRSYVFATMGSQPTSEFAEIMVIPHTPHRRSSTRQIPATVRTLTRCGIRPAAPMLLRCNRLASVRVPGPKASS